MAFFSTTLLDVGRGSEALAMFGCREKFVDDHNKELRYFDRAERGCLNRHDALSKGGMRSESHQRPMI